MVGPFGSPDDVWAFKVEMNILGSILFAVFASSVALGPFENKTRQMIARSGDALGYTLAKGYWTFALLWLAFAWYLVARSSGLGFNLLVGYYATLTGSVVANVFWPRLYFVDSGKPARYWASLFVLALGWLSAFAALVLHSVNMWQSWAALTARASSIVAAIFVFVHMMLMLGAFVYFYAMQGELRRAFRSAISGKSASE